MSLVLTMPGITDDDSKNQFQLFPVNVEDNKLFGKYELRKLIGCGAFAKVYHAKNIRTGESVAIKAVNKEKISKQGLTAHLKREIYIMRQLQHSHIVRIFEVLATKTKVYFVLEYAKGGELFSKVAKGRFSEELSRGYFQQLISAVGYCHSRGVYHRDLKLENLLLDENWDLKITDFGLSAISEQIHPDGLLHTMCGTPAYVAPEILAKKGYHGAKVDIWSCGIILYVLTAGYLPFNDPSLIAMYRKIYKGEFRCPKWMSPDLKRLLSRLLDKNPQTRITVDEIVNDPWFKKGLRRNRFSESAFEVKTHEDEGKYLNAFDIISFSSGVDLSGLFNHSDDSFRVERFLSAESPGRIIAKIDKVAKQEELTMVRLQNWVAKVEGQNGDLVAQVEINRLTDKLVVVEIKRRNDEVGIRLKAEISGLIHVPEKQVAGI